MAPLCVWSPANQSQVKISFRTDRWIELISISSYRLLCMQKIFWSKLCFGIVCLFCFWSYADGPKGQNCLYIVYDAAQLTRAKRNTKEYVRTAWLRLKHRRWELVCWGERHACRCVTEVGYGWGGEPVFARLVKRDVISKCVRGASNECFEILS